jgi:hypothetical protein
MRFKVLNEVTLLLIGKGLEGGCHDIFQSVIPAMVWKNTEENRMKFWREI